MIVKCQGCKATIEINFSENDKIAGGINEKCPACGVAVWISCKNKGVAQSPLVLLNQVSRKTLSLDLY